MRFNHFRALAVALLTAAGHALGNNNGPDYEHLPRDTIFPGPWEANIRAPVNKSYITPQKISRLEGEVRNAESVLEGAKLGIGSSWSIGRGGLVTFEFAESISGRVCFEVDDIKGHPHLVLSYSESPFFAGRDPDATGDQLARDLPLSYMVTHTGLNCVAKGYNRGAFKYLTAFIPESDVPAEGGFWHEGHTPPPTKEKYSLGGKIAQAFFSRASAGKNPAKTRSSVIISALWVNCTAFPSHSNGRAYTGYFDSSSSLLNRVWYAGAWTLQLSTLDPTEGGSIIDFNKFFDHNKAPRGAWYSNYTIANGSVVTTDGAKRDRMVWPGDMTIAVPGVAVSTYDMLAVRNALDTIYDHQYGDGSMPYAGPPMGAFGEFSDTYHLHTLVGTYAYILYSGDLDWLRGRWPAFVRALEVSIAKVDSTNLLHVTSIFDWNRSGMTGHNVEASSILFDVLGNSIKLASWLGYQNTTTNGEDWVTTQARLRMGISTLYCPADGMYADNMGRRGCSGEEKVLPQDGNGWALLSRAVEGAQARKVSENLRSRWTKFGAPAVEFPNVMSPFASSFELLGHASAGNFDAAVELIELMWGYMLDGPGMTNSTLIEGYRTDGYVHYPAYWSAARNSHAHGWATGPTTVLMQGILGIKLLTPLGKTWEIEPHLSKWLSYARGGFATKLGKFEVVTTRMKVASSGRNVEELIVTVPEGTEGTVKWGGKGQARTQQMAKTFKLYRYSEPGATEEEEWQDFNANDLVIDDEWKKPIMEERKAGVVDFNVLEDHYLMAEMRTTPEIWEIARQHVQMEGIVEDSSVEKELLAFMKSRRGSRRSCHVV